MVNPSTQRLFRERAQSTPVALVNRPEPRQGTLQCLAEEKDEPQAAGWSQQKTEFRSLHNDKISTAPRCDI